MAVTTKIWSFQTIGVEVPKPGIFIFHFTFSVSLQVVGGFAPGATPLARGPRHLGQSPLDFEACSAAESERAAVRPTDSERDQARNIAALSNTRTGILFRSSETHAKVGMSLSFAGSKCKST